MPKISNPELLWQPEQCTLSIRTHTNATNLPKQISDSYRKLASYLSELGALTTDVPFIAYHNLDSENLDIEMGFPVREPLPGKEDIQPNTIPARKVVFCMYRGPYIRMKPTYNDMVEWIGDKGYQRQGSYYEYYYNGLSFSDDDLLTKIVLPVEEQ